MAGGIVFFNNKLHWQSRFHNGSETRGLYLCQSNSKTEYDYVDNIDAIDFDLLMQWDDFDQPYNFVKPIFLQVYNFLNEQVYRPFSLQVEEYRDYDETNVRSAMSRTYTSTTKEKRMRFRTGKSRVSSLRFRNNNILEQALITGWAYQIMSSYIEKIRDRKG